MRSAAKAWPSKVALPASANSKTSLISSSTEKLVASNGTVVFTLYVKTSLRFVSVSEALSLTVFSIGGCSGFGGVTGTSFESLRYFGLLSIT